MGLCLDQEPHAYFLYDYGVLSLHESIESFVKSVRYLHRKNNDAVLLAATWCSI